MGQNFSIDTTTNIIFGVVMVIVGGITILQTAHLARLTRRATLTDEERGQVDVVEMVAHPTEPVDEHQLQLEQSSVFGAAVASIFDDARTGNIVRTWEETMAFGSAVEVLQSIGASFADAETEGLDPAIDRVAPASAVAQLVEQGSLEMQP